MQIKRSSLEARRLERRILGELMDNEVETPTKKFARKRENRRRLNSEIARLRIWRRNFAKKKFRRQRRICDQRAAPQTAASNVRRMKGKYLDSASKQPPARKNILFRIDRCFVKLRLASGLFLFASTLLRKSSPRRST